MAGAAPNAEAEREKSKRIGALASLWPFLAPYRGLLAAAVVALILTAVVSLVLPLAVRRVVDGFETSAEELLDSYFLAALGIALLFAAGSATRYYLVTRLGERVVADIRKAVFDRMIGMSPAFYERIMTGEVLSRITTDTTLILSVIGSSISIALRNVLILVGGLAMLFFTSAKLAGLVLLIVPARDRADHPSGPAPPPAVAREPGLDRVVLGQRVRGAAVGPDGAGLHERRLPPAPPSRT